MRNIPFVGALLVVLLLVLRVSTQSNGFTLPTKLQDFITLSSSVIIEAMPFVLLGLALSIIVQIWLPDKLLFKILPKRPLPRRIVLSFFGVFLPVCECGNVPLARGLMLQGMSVGDSLTFLLAAPILNPITIITTQQAFPSDNTVLFARLLGGFLIANIVGWLFATYKNPKQLTTPGFAATCDAHHDEGGHEHKRVRKSLEVFGREANVIVPALFMGGFAAGAIQTFVPRSILTDLGGHLLLSIIAMMVLAFVISICANVDAFFALAFANSFTTGSIVAFLIFGPIVDIKMLSLMQTTYRKRVLATITLVTTLISLTIGLAVNYAF